MDRQTLYLLCQLLDLKLKIFDYTFQRLEILACWTNLKKRESVCYQREGKCFPKTGNKISGQWWTIGLYPDGTTWIKNKIIMEKNKFRASSQGAVTEAGWSVLLSYSQSKFKAFGMHASNLASTTEKFFLSKFLTRTHRTLLRTMIAVLLKLIIKSKDDHYHYKIFYPCLAHNSLRMNNCMILRYLCRNAHSHHYPLSKGTEAKSWLDW